MRSPGVTARNRLKRAFRVPAVRNAALRAAAVKGRGLTLLFHRVAPDGAQPEQVVPAVDLSLFRRQIEALAQVGQIVPAEELARSPGRAPRLRFALTFDDDYPCHADHALPVLRELDVPATFFLSGRALHGLGPYWWEVLERRIASDGLAGTSRLLGLSASTPAALAAACEASPAAERLAQEPGGDAAPLSVTQIAQLGAAERVTIGFHTVHHPVLPTRSLQEVQHALTAGRSELMAATGQSLTLFAYPHGKANQAVAAAVAAAGYQAAWTGRQRPMRRGDDRFLLGRWEPGSLDVDDFMALLAIRLHRGNEP